MMTNKTSEIIYKIKKAICKLIQKEFGIEDGDKRRLSDEFWREEKQNCFYVNFYGLNIKLIEDAKYYVRAEFEITYLDDQQISDIQDRLTQTLLFKDLVLDDGRRLQVVRPYCGKIGYTLHLRISYDYIVGLGSIFK